MRKKNKFIEEESIEISLTPLIDTILVLLIVFIIISPQLESILKIDTPSIKSNQTTVNNIENYFCIAINQFGSLFLKNSESTNYEIIIQKGKEFLNKKNNNNKLAIIFADKDVLLQKTTDLIDILYSIGFEKVYLKTKEINF